MGTVEQNSPVKMVFTVIAATLAISAIAQSVPVPSPQTAQDWARWTAVNPADWAKVTNVDWSGATGNIDCPELQMSIGAMPLVSQLTGVEQSTSPVLVMPSLV